ncbi:MAG: hypothetical protein F3745_06580, partial [Nitrospinae bacterium]|nr:hypothetical protein [Nitrospinota bacterium]
MNKNFLKLLLLLTIFFLFNTTLLAFDSSFEGRYRVGSQYVFESPPFHKDFDSELELRLGLLGSFLESEEWILDYELTADARHLDGPSVQSRLFPETDVNFFRAWLR